MSYFNSGNRIQTDSPIVFNLIVLNVLVYLAQLFIGDKVTDAIALYPVNSDFFKPYQLVTHMFAHSPTLYIHIIFNMLALWMFGSVLERFWGPKRFLIFYLACGLAAGILHITMQYIRYKDQGAMTWDIYDQLVSQGTVTARYMLGGAVGASGAVMGVLAAFAYLFPNTNLYMMFIPIAIKAKYAIPVMVAIDLFGGFANIQGDSVAHFAHLGGALTGFILVLIWNKTNRRTFY